MTMSKWPTEIKREHIALIHYVWIELLPKFAPIPFDKAWELWARFIENPSAANDLELQVAQRAVNELWLLHVQAN
jgi:hypothetical protein